MKKIPKNWFQRVFLVVGGFFAWSFLFFLFSAGPFGGFTPQLLDFTGYPFSHRNYLVLFQDEYEIAPSGGAPFLSALLSFKHGLYCGLQPLPFLDVSNIPIDPDFSLNGEAIRRQFGKELNMPLHGVIAVNMAFLEDWLALHSSLSLSGVRYDRDDFYAWFAEKIFSTRIVQAASLSDIGGSKNTMIDGDAASTFISVLHTKTLSTPWRWRKFSSRVFDHLNKKNILLSFEDESLQAFTARAEWDSAFPATADEVSGDFLALSETNQGENKANRFLKRIVNYTVTIDEAPDGTFFGRAALDVKYANFGSEEFPLGGTYLGSLRIFTPIMSKIFSRDSTRETTDRSWHVFEKDFSLAPGEKTTFHYEYELSPHLFDGKTYRLKLWQPPGASTDEYSVVVNAPAYMQFQSDDMEVREHTAFWDGVLSKDSEFSVQMKETNQPLKLLSAHLRIEPRGAYAAVLEFNRPLQSLEMSDLTKFEFIDTNEFFPNANDQVLATGISQDSQSLSLSLHGMTRQPGEKFTLVIHDISDRVGNFLLSNPTEIELMQ